MSRGEVYRVSSNDRSVLTVVIVQEDVITAAYPTVIALPITTMEQQAVTVPLASGPGLTFRAWVEVNHPQTLPQSALIGPLGRLDAETMTQIDRTLVALLGLEGVGVPWDWWGPRR